jgi:hypothetical protein
LKQIGKAQLCDRHLIRYLVKDKGSEYGDTCPAAFEPFIKARSAFSLNDEFLNFELLPELKIVSF